VTRIRRSDLRDGAPSESGIHWGTVVNGTRLRFKRPRPFLVNVASLADGTTKEVHISNGGDLSSFVRVPIDLWEVPRLLVMVQEMGSYLSELIDVDRWERLHRVIIEILGIGYVYRAPPYCALCASPTVTCSLSFSSSLLYPVHPPRLMDFLRRG
jgi:hypothetical protein